MTLGHYRSYSSYSFLHCCGTGLLIKTASQRCNSRVQSRPLGKTFESMMCLQSCGTSVGRLPLLKAYLFLLEIIFVLKLTTHICAWISVFVTKNPNKSESCWIPSSGCLNRRIELEYSSCMESPNLTEKRYLDGILASRNDYDLYSIGLHQICNKYKIKCLQSFPGM